jgi:hypothetical protein
MTHLRKALWLILLFAPLNCFATSTHDSDLSVNLNIFPNDGTGDNLGGTILGPGVSLTVGGGTPYYWFNNVDGFAPGSGGGGSTTIYFDSVFGTIGSKSYSELFIGAATLNAGGFTFPTDGEDFAISVPASIGLIVLTGCTNSGCQTFNVITKPGVLTLSFDYYAGTGLYYGAGGSFVSTTTPVPEPGTISLMILGLASIARLRHRNRAPV